MRIIILLVLVGLISGCSVNKGKFDNLYRSAKAIEGATAVGVSSDKFGELLQNFATEITILNDKVTGRQEVALLEIYKTAFGIYQDSVHIWDYTEGRSGTVYGDELLLLEKYKVPVVKFKADGAHVGYDAVPDIWAVAEKRLKVANSFLNSLQFWDSPEKALNRIRQSDNEATLSTETQTQIDSGKHQVFDINKQAWVYQ